MAIQQLAYLKSKFENGDFPNQTDFHDLIDSTYNYNLSVLPEFFAFLQPLTGNWEETYTIVRANSGENWSYQGLDIKALSGNWQSTYQNVSTNSSNWQNAYQTSLEVIAVSSTFATVQYTNSNFMPSSGGVIQNSLNVQKNILSGGSNLFDLFLAKPYDFQNLSFNKDTSELSISNGASTSLSALESFVGLTFGHSLINPLTSTIYHFGAITSIQPATLSRLSRSVISQYNGNAVEASITSSFEGSSGSNENSIFRLYNKTTNVSALITNNYKYFDTITNVSSQSFRGGSLPGGWSASSVTFETDDGGYARLNSQIGTTLVSPTFDGRAFARLSASFKVALFGDSGEPGPVTVEYSLNGVDGPWLLAGYSPVPVNSVDYVNADVPITVVSSNMAIRLKRDTSASALRLRDLNFVGIGGDGAQIGNFVITPHLPVRRNDLLEIEWTTPVWANRPTNVINFVNVKIKIND
jgi:hypothetical protein